MKNDKIHAWNDEMKWSQFFKFLYQIFLILKP